MNIKSELRKEGIEVVSKLERNKVNLIAKDISKRLTKSFPEQNINYYELFAKLSNLNMYIANIPNGIAAKYFYKNNSIYFNSNYDLNNLGSVAIHECIHSLQAQVNSVNKLSRLGLCNFADPKLSGMGINEAAVQYMAMKSVGAKMESVKYFEVDIPTISPNYYALECNLIRQMAYITGEYVLFNSTLYSNNSFEDKFIALTNKETYEKIKYNINYIIYLEDTLNCIYSKLQSSNYISANYFKLMNKAEKIKANIRDLFIITQNRIFTSYFDNCFDSLYTDKSIENFRTLLYNYKDLIGVTDNYTFFNNYYISKMTDIERKYSNSENNLALLLPVKQTYFSILIRKIKVLFGIKNNEYNTIYK